MERSLTPHEKRAQLRDALRERRTLAFPGAFSPLVARAIADAGFPGVYVGGASLSADLGLPDIGLITASEVTARAGAIANATDLPTLVDVDTGFGEPLNVARTLVAIENAGLAGLHLEDQENPKRCGHLDGKTIVSIATMERKIAAARQVRRDPNFLIAARTDARSVEGLDRAIARARAYRDAGADAIFPEALADEREFARMREAVPDVPLIANMTEFGKSPLLTRAQLEGLGYEIIIYPVTLLRIAMGAIERGLRSIAQSGSQAALVEKMQTRARLYELLGYGEYAAFDAAIFDFSLPND